MFSMYSTWCGVRPCRSARRVSSCGPSLSRFVFRNFDEAELHVVDAQVARGAVVEVLDRLRRALRLLAAHRELRAAARDGDVERRFDLPQVLVERAAQPREPLVVDRIELDFDRFAPSASSPRSECERAAVIRTSTKPSRRPCPGS
jgi:hypothetical protein